MADFEQPEVLPQPTVDRKIQLRNSYSEFRRVENALVHDDSTLGKVCHCINTIEELNERIGNLSNALDAFTRYEKGFLEIDEDFEDNNQDAVVHLPSIESQEKKRKQVKQFAGMYSCMTVLDKDNDIINKRPTFKKIASSITKKPMLVELHTFPGFDTECLTPLPAPLSPLFIFNIVINAQSYLKNKFSFRLKYRKFFTTQESTSVFQDSFWWFFCHKYQPYSASQQKLFDRIARNYTKLLFTWSEREFQDKYFMHYDSMIAQAIYATFCHAFPTSYRQFNGEFRDELASLITLWMMGIRPPPRSWESWDFDALEPCGLRKGEKIQEGAVKAKTLDLELNKVEVNRLNSAGRGARRLSKIVRTLGSVNHSDEIKSPENTKDIVSQGKTLPHRSDENNKSMDNIMKQISSVLGVAEQTRRKKSSPVGDIAVFRKAVFNVNGRSPLVEHFLATKNLNEHIKTSVLVQRTEIKSLPPPTCETYDDIIENAIVNRDKAKEQFENSTCNNANERRKFSQKRTVDNANFTARSTKLLSNPKEVRKISELLKIPEKEEQEEADVRAARLRNLLAQTFGDEL